MVEKGRERKWPRGRAAEGIRENQRVSRFFYVLQTVSLSRGASSRITRTNKPAHRSFYHRVVLLSLIPRHTAPGLVGQLWQASLKLSP